MRSTLLQNSAVITSWVRWLSVSSMLVGWSLMVGATRVEAAKQAAPYRTVTTEHFVIQSTQDAKALNELGARCEALLTELRTKWFDDQALTAWQPKCLVVVHDTLSSYVREVPGGERTLGSSWIETEKGRIVTRRIDLRGDKAEWFDGALPHELIHVLLADRFGTTPPGRWAEEGWAILADPTEKQFRHDADLRRAVARGEHFRLGEILELTEYPGAERITAFYGQSASMVRFLAERRTPADFAAFLKGAASQGYDAALREHYGLDGVADLERRWLADLESDRFVTTSR
ncbi:MAG: hypothetical protein K8U03_02080 [Planctomycetia bacterium]|nr:hypothetical protein [Planctomycetia bacterium]